MRLGLASYADFQSVIGALNEQPKAIFYKPVTLTPTDVASAFVVFPSRDYYIEAGFPPGDVTVTSFTTDYPSAVVALVNGTY